MIWTRFLDRMISFWFPLLLLIVLLISWSPLSAAPVAVAVEGDVTIILTNEPCKLDVKLPYRMIWEERGKKTFEGCFNVHGGIVVMFFEDKSLGLVSSQAFRPATGI